MLRERHFGHRESDSFQCCGEGDGVVYGEALVGDYVFFFVVGEVFEVGNRDVFVFFVIAGFLIILAGGGIAVAFVDACEINPGNR